MKSGTAHIAHVCAYYPPHLGGLERVAAEVAEQLARDGYPVTVLTSDIGADTPSAPSVSGLTIKRLRSFEFAHTAFIPGLLWQLLRASKPVIFHLHLAQAYVPEMLWIAAKLRGIPYVVHYHLDVERSGRLGFLFDIWKRTVQPVVMAGAARIVTLSPEQRLIVIERYRIPAERVSCIENGVGDAFLSIGDAPRTPHDPLRLLFVGRLSPQKRVERLIEALSLTKSPLSLSIVGDGEDRAKLEDLVRQLDLKNITFSGALREDALLQAYRDADLFVLPSDREGMPLAVLEAMAAGLPVLGSDVLGIAELIEGVGVAVKDPSAANFAAAIDVLALDGPRLHRMSQASTAKAQRYSWEKLVAQIEELYRTIRV